MAHEWPADIQRILRACYGASVACKRGWLVIRSPLRRFDARAPGAVDNVIPAQAGIQYVQLYLPLPKGPP